MIGLIKYYGSILFTAFCIVSAWLLAISVIVIIPAAVFSNLSFVYALIISFVCWVVALAVLIALFDL